MSTDAPPPTGAPATPGGRSTAPAEGERRAQRGYTHQYDAAAAAIYCGLDRGDLRWVGLADRCAGIADDVVLGYDGEVIGHQFKSARDPAPFRIVSLLTGSNGLLLGLVRAWQELRESYPGQTVRIRVVVSNTPSDNDRLNDDAGTTRQFVKDWQADPSRTLADWRASPWGSFVEHLLTESGLDEPGFEEFLHHLELVHGDQPDFATRFGITAQCRPQVDRIAQRLPTLIARVPEQDRWSREAFLREMGWRDVETLHRHQFPVGAAVQRNPTTESELRLALGTSPSGYVSLVGPPGSGKSTLLQIAFEAEPRLVVVRYLAFVPGAAQGIGRAEAADFQEDLIVGLRRTGLQGIRFRRESPQERREELETLLTAASARYQETSVRTLIVVDGLDHVPREERPERSFLSELPLPASIPEGVVFLLGTQRVDLAGMPPSVRDQSDMPGRRVEMAPLSQGAISTMADVMGLPETVSRSRLRELAQGHPLATHYLIEALLAADNDAERARILEDGFEYVGDIDALYASALRGLDDDNEVMDVLSLVARAEAPLELAQLEQFCTPPAVERAWRSVRHLLVRKGGGWSIFHNSFRLFVARIPRLRFGVPDPDYSTRLYRQLAEIAAQASEGSPQRHLRLRYLMRAGAHQQVLALATPAMFREQFLAGRPSSSIQDDIRLAFHSLKEVRDPAAAFRLIFASDELSRRASAFEEPDDTVRALLALGYVDEAESFIDEIGGDGYAVVGAWLDQGNVERARTLFERIEPLHDLGSNDSGSISQHRELAKWVEQAVEFRTPAEIAAGIDRIVEVARRDSHPFQDPAELGSSLRARAAMSAIASNPTGDVNALITEFRLKPGAQAMLRLWAASHLLSDRRMDEAEALVSGISAAALAETPDWLRRDVALQGAHGGNLDLARAIAQGLSVPAIAETDDSTDYDSIKQVAGAVIEHAELGWSLDAPSATPPQSQEPLLRPLQQFCEHAGRLAARTRSSPDAVGHGEIAQECARFLRYVCRSDVPGTGDYFAVGRLASAAPEVIGSLLASAGRIGSDELMRTVSSIDQILGDYPQHRRVPIEIVVARSVARWGNNVEDAERRLDLLLEYRDENTPSEFLSSTARLARAFAQIGRPERARTLLAEQRAETLGYALRAKKDPQYAFWMALMREANRAYPATRSQRVRTLARQAVGMAETEGSDAAGRIAHDLVVEAAMDGAQLSWSVASALIDAGLIDLPEVIDALMIGTIARDQGRVRACVETWVSLCLPFHRAPYYRESKEAWFIGEAIRSATPNELDDIANILLSNIELHSQIDVRPSLLEALRLELAKRGVDSEGVRAAAARVAGEATLPRSGGDSPTPYDDVESMDSLAARLEEVPATDSVDYGATKAFRRLVPSTDLDVALAVFDRHSRINQDHRARFLLVDRASGLGCNDVASRLTGEYAIADDRSSSWSSTMGGGRRRFFQARLKLEGQSVHEVAYANFVSALASGEEMINLLLWDIDDIWPVLEGDPDWPAMWESVEEQLPLTRDYRLGQDIQIADVASDSILIAKLFEEVSALPVSEAQWHAERGSLAISVVDQGAFFVLVAKLLAGSEEAVIMGLRLALSAGNVALRNQLASRVGMLVDHDDVVVRTLAKAVATQLGVESARRGAPIPVFYQLSLPPLESATSSETLLQRPFGPPVVSDVAAWSAPVEHIVKRISAAADVSEDHVRRRIQQLIDSWGGIEAFGQPGIDRLQSTLSKFGLRLTYRYPHVVGALRALRHIAGELERADRIQGEEIEGLLHAVGVSREPLRTTINRRPAFVRRPTMPRGFGSDEQEAWLAAVEEDVIDAETGSDTILAEVTHFHGRIAFTRYEWSRMRLFGTRLPDHVDPQLLYDGLPTSGPVPGPGTNASPEGQMPVRRVVRAGLASLPSFELTLGTALTDRLGWRSAEDSSTSWFDREGRLVAAAYCWRDGGPDGQTHGDCLWGEGAAILLTAIGRSQLEALVGPRSNSAAARRCKQGDNQRRESFANRHP